MPDLRIKIKNYAKNALGTRVWARRHVVNPEKTKLEPLVSNYNWREKSYLCERLPQELSRDRVTVLSDKRTNNDLRGRSKRAREVCNVNVGECWDLAYAALDKHNGLSRVSNYGGNDRKWSNTTLDSLTDIKGGEILELKPTLYFFRFKYEQNENFIRSYESEMIQVGPNIPHTAVINGANKSRGEVEVYHQNFSQGGVLNLMVHLATFPVSNTQFNEGSKKVLQAVGGPAVNKFNTRLTAMNITNANFGSDTIQRKMKNLINSMESHVRTNSGIPSKVIVYVPESA